MKAWLSTHHTVLILSFGLVVSALFTYLDWSMGVFIGSLISIVGGLLAYRADVRSQRDMKAIITGGDSYCYVSPGVGDGKSNQVEFRLVNEGEYPLFGVFVRVANPKDKIAVLQKELERLPAHTNRLLGTLLLPEKQDSLTLRVVIFALNGQVTEDIQLTRSEGAWKASYQVKRGFGIEEKVLKSS